MKLTIALLLKVFMISGTIHFCIEGALLMKVYLYICISIYSFSPSRPHLVTVGPHHGHFFLETVKSQRWTMIPDTLLARAQITWGYVKP